MARVLVVEDDAPLRQLLNSMLHSAGHEVVQAADGAEGMAKANEVEPELVVTDYVMPVMDGVDLVKRLRSVDRFHDVPVIVYSAYPVDERVESILAEENIRYLQKGDTLTDLIRQADELLEAS